MYAGGPLHPTRPAGRRYTVTIPTGLIQMVMQRSEGGNEFHRDVKQNILNQARQEFSSQFSRVGNNPNIHIDSKGFIRLVHAQNPSIYLDTGWRIITFLP